MNPLVGGNGHLAADLDGIARPGVMEADSNVPVFQQQFVTATPGVGGRFRVLENHLARRGSLHLQPERDGKWNRACKVSDARKSESLVGLELRVPSSLSLDH